MVRKLRKHPASHSRIEVILPAQGSGKHSNNSTMFELSAAAFLAPAATARALHLINSDRGETGFDEAFRCSENGLVLASPRASDFRRF
jgi:hypothetical protein